MTFHPKAKVNLGLNVVERRPDGYHNLETVFLPIDVEDVLDVSIAADADEPVSITVEGTDALCPLEDNLVYKAYMLLKQDLPLPNVRVRLTKQIPSQAGLGGGSSDAAYMIRALNEVCGLQLSDCKMQQYAARLGADCPLFIKAETVYATGIGDILMPQQIPALSEHGRYIMALVKLPVAVSTREAYSAITPRQPSKCCRDIVQQPIETWKDELVNDFEESVFKKLPMLADVKQKLYDLGAVYAAMSGSGSTVFGIFPNTHDTSSTCMRVCDINADASLPSLFTLHFPNAYTKIITL